MLYMVDSKFLAQCLASSKNSINLWKCETVSCSVMSHSLWPHELQAARLLCPWDSPGQNTGVGSCSLLQEIFPTQGSNPGLLHCRQILWATRAFPPPMHESEKWKWSRLVVSDWLLATPWTAAYQAPPSMGFSRQEYWSGVPLPSPNKSLAVINSFNLYHNLWGKYYYQSNLHFCKLM